MQTQDAPLEIPEAWGNTLAEGIPHIEARMYSKDRRYFTIIFSAANDTVVCSAFRDQWRTKVRTSRGKTSGEVLGELDSKWFKEETGDTQMKPSRLMPRLGNLPVGALGHQYSEKHLPVADSDQTIVCLKTNIHPSHKPQKERHGYVMKEGECTFKCTIYSFETLGKRAITIEFGKHSHSCPSENDHHLPMPHSLLRFLVLAETLNAEVLCKEPAGSAERSSQGLFYR
jgi:hypothetical protein